MILAAPKWNAGPQHNWPDGDYIGVTCSECGVSGFFHHKNGPRLCYPHWLESQTREAERKARWMDDMVGEYGPYRETRHLVFSWPPGTFNPSRERLKPEEAVRISIPKGFEIT